MSTSTLGQWRRLAVSFPAVHCDSVSVQQGRLEPGKGVSRWDLRRRMTGNVPRRGCGALRTGAGCATTVLHGRDVRQQPRDD